MKDKLLDEYQKNHKKNTQSNDAHIYSGLLGLIPSQRKDNGTKHQQNNKKYGGLLGLIPSQRKDNGTKHQKNNKKYGGLLDVETE